MFIGSQCSVRSNAGGSGAILTTKFHESEKRTDIDRSCSLNWQIRQVVDDDQFCSRAADRRRPFGASGHCSCGSSSADVISRSRCGGVSPSASSLRKRRRTACVGGLRPSYLSAACLPASSIAGVSISPL